MEEPKKLSADVAAKYNLVGVNAGRVILPAKYGREEVDFSNMTLQKADALIEKYKDFPYLKLKQGGGRPSSTTA